MDHVQGTKGAERKARLTLWWHIYPIMSLAGEEGGMVAIRGGYTEMTDLMVS